MTYSNKRLLQKSIAVIVIIAILQMVGVSPLLMLFATGIVFVVWIANRRSQNRELANIFNFYVAADSILRNEDRRWYGFEVVEVIEEGERVSDWMPDCPPLHLFALGALYHRLGRYEASVEYLGRVVEDEVYDERQNTTPSPQLRCYVSMLRRLETTPSIAPAQLAAVRSLERQRRKHASQLLHESRNLLNLSLENAQVSGLSSSKQTVIEPVASQPGSTVVRPPISEVLHDVYDENTSLN